MNAPSVSVVMPARNAAATLEAAVASLQEEHAAELEKLQADRGERRLKVTETLVLDPARRLVLVQIDNEERLLLLGEGKELTGPQAVRPLRAMPLGDRPERGA